MPLRTPPGIVLEKPPQAPPWLAIIMTAATVVMTAACASISGQPHSPPLAAATRAAAWIACAATLAATVLLSPMWGCLTLLVDATNGWLLWRVFWPLWGAAGLTTLRFVATVVGAADRLTAVGWRAAAASVAPPVAAWPARVATTVVVAGAPSPDGRGLFGGLSLLFLGASVWAVGRALAAAPSRAEWVAVATAGLRVCAAMAVAAAVGGGVFAWTRFTLRGVAAARRARAHQAAGYVPLVAAAAVAVVPSVGPPRDGNGTAAGRSHPPRVKAGKGVVRFAIGVWTALCIVGVTAFGRELLMTLLRRPQVRDVWGHVIAFLSPLLYKVALSWLSKSAMLVLGATELALCGWRAVTAWRAGGGGGDALVAPVAA